MTYCFWSLSTPCAIENNPAVSGVAAVAVDPGSAPQRPATTACSGLVYIPGRDRETERQRDPENQRDRETERHRDTGTQIESVEEDRFSERIKREGTEKVKRKKE